MRKKKLILNSVTSLLTQLMTIICGLIIPRLIISAYGSQVNGLVSSITQFLSVISLLDLGVGAVVQTALYRPLAEKDDLQISKIVVSSDRFFRRIAKILLLYVGLLMVIYPHISNSTFNGLYISSLIVIVAISSFVQYYWGVTNQILLNADQRIYVQTGLQCIVLVLNAILCYILIKIGASIQLVKLASAVVFILRPAIMQLYVKRHYNINKKIVLQDEPIKQKWNGLAQHMASYVLDNTDVVVLTLFSTLESVSVYTVYFNIVYGIRKMLMAVFNSFQSLWGNMIAKGEKELLNESFETTEWLLHNVVTVLFGITGALIVPFVALYTQGVEDTKYILPIFALVIVLANAAHCIRLPYMMMIYSAGAFKETQNSAWIEAGINIALSVILVQKYDLIGVAFGTLIAMIYRTIYLAWYLSKNIINRPIKYFCKRILLDIICTGEVILSMKVFPISIENITVITWVIHAVTITIIVTICAVITNIIFDFPKVRKTFDIIKSKKQ